MVSLRILITLQLFVVIFAAPEQGKFSKTITDSEEVGFVKTLYKDSKVRLKVTSSKCEPSNASLTIKWLMRSSSCYGEYTAIMSGESGISLLMTVPELSHPYGRGYYIRNQGEDLDCSKTMTFTDHSSHNWTAYPKDIPTTTTGTTTTTITTKPDAQRRKKRATTDQTQPPSSTDGTETDAPLKPENVGQTTKPKPDKHVIASTPHEAPYILIVKVEKSKDSTESFEVTIVAEMESQKGYLSAHEYPLLTFFMIMCIIYSLYAVAWFVMSACNFRDLLRVQFWIGGVILLGMIEKAVFYSEYLSVNSTGESVTGASKFAEVVSAMKRALARMLVIIVSLGFGIVKPRLGPMLHRVIGVGILYFILAVIEALVRTDSPIRDPSSNDVIFASIPLAVIDSIICWWIFMSLMQTMKTLRLRRNVVKLSLYRHFSNTIIFCVIASLAMIFYSLRYRDQCMTNWQELWVDNAFWHILFSIILLVIMVLWRPSLNNQRYAFSPLIDGDADEEAEEPMLGGAGATETVKMRGLRNVSDVNHDHASKAEDDLKWIEENIPQTVADAALPAIMDSDEEVMTTKYEMSKME